MNKKAPSDQKAFLAIPTSHTSASSIRQKIAALTGSMILAFAWMSVTAFPSPASAETASSDSPTGKFSGGSLRGWKERSFAGNTDYELVDEQGIQVLKGHTDGQASIFYKEQDIDLRKTPLLEWSWKVDQIYAGLDERSREGDDFPARLYVVVKMGLLPWDTLAINYVWSADAALGDSWANPFTDRARMVVVQSGSRLVGSWVTQRRNVAQDFKTFFGEDIKKLNGYAVMVDGDNAKRQGTAWFGQIEFGAE